MSRDVEAGDCIDVTIPLIEIIDKTNINSQANDGGSNGKGASTHLSSHQSSLAENLVERAVDAASDVLQPEPKYRIDYTKPTQENYKKIAVIKLKPKYNNEATKDDLDKCSFDFMDNPFAFIDSADNLPEGGFDLLQKMQEISGGIQFITNGYLNADIKIVKALAVISTSEIFGDVFSNSEYDKWINVFIYDNIVSYPDYAYNILLLEGASKCDVFRYEMAIMKALFDSHLCSRVIMNGSKEILISIAKGEYFKDNIGTLVAKNCGLLSSALYSFVEAYKNELKLPEEARKDLISVCQEFISDNDEIDIELT